MKTINFELSKRLNELGLIKNTELFLNPNTGSIINPSNPRYFESNNIPTLTLEEAIEFLPKEIKLPCNELGNPTIVWYNKWIISYMDKSDKCYYHQEADNLLEAIEKMIEYLLDNNLLTK